jgi:hypothetical protein
VSGVPALIETLGNFAHIIKPVTVTTMSRFENHGGEIAHFNPTDFAKALNEVYHAPVNEVREIPSFPWVLEPLIEYFSTI